ncbi:MAG: oligosaccharide flippase family protein, partial [Clostridia bacterium]|nr:oligosaccharide flippase family protein [Clostridia bacterium]
MKENIYRTATLVTALSVAERALGFLYRIVLSRFLGAEGLGIYQVALSVFGVFVTVGTGGIPVTVSRLISKSKAEQNINAEKSACASGLLAALLFTLPVYLLFYPFKNAFSFLFSDDGQMKVFSVLLI